ncbi:BTB/POZ domain-containing protein At5g48800 isoform X2 [Selaginella moellendorffii]|uniref:BTB/POZ domain-containing protein At5g48800 isoform X2 n=1 Tax=Selaginella moellendorffii TaxID=88036 RepID=UPI000D1CB42B|nr:BTB/POZ domain-containing protein At5g48800 isoform X2 [Selaginella moellendorffii]|eukprot:XP_024530714.1 BTB/POZ domain-containing protein At5g48800 isoform X2 [Selaginella moellendorffii]
MIRFRRTSVARHHHPHSLLPRPPPRQQQRQQLRLQLEPLQSQQQNALSNDVPTDISVEVAGTSFALHKFPLVSRSGRIRKLVVETRDLDPSQIKLLEIPGGAEVFELVAKFCYGINFEITTANVAVLRCAAHYLEMTDDYGEGNLVVRTETYLNEVVIQDFSVSLAVLHNCENLVPLAEELKIVSRCVDAVAAIATASLPSREQLSSSMEYNGSSGWIDSQVQSCKTDHWWSEDLAILRIDFYQRTLAAMMSRGLLHESIGGALIIYAQRYLKGLNMKPVTSHNKTKLAPAATVHDSGIPSILEQEQRALVETLTSMLPCEKNSISCSFLFGLLRSAIILDASISCRIELEQRIGMQMDQAALDDLLIPSMSFTCDTLFDVDVVQRLVINFLQHKEKEDSQAGGYESESTSPPSQSAAIKVAKLIDNYLAEIAPDTNLKLLKFYALAELVPDYARVVNDGLYRAIDIYLKAHSNLSEGERKKICKLMDVQKLSQEACSHAAQNERLPVQVVVQVLYFEQVRLRAAMAASMMEGDNLGHFHHKLGSGALSAAISPRDHYASIRRENRELKLEVARMRMRLTELEKEHVCMKQEMEKTSSTAHNFLHSVSRRLSRLNPFGSRNQSHVAAPQTPDSRVSSRRRRHSIS